LAAVTFSISASVAAQADPVTFTISSKTRGPLKPSDNFEVQVHARIKEGWHLYSLTQQPGGPVATRITLPANQPFKLTAAIKSPPPLTDSDPNFGVDTQFYENSVTFKLPVAVSDSANISEKERLRVNVFFQTCNDQFCLPPKTVRLGLTLALAAGAPNEEQKDHLLNQPEQPSSISNSLQSPSPVSQEGRAVSQPANDDNARQGSSVPVNFAPYSTDVISLRNLLSFIVLAASLGALSLLTPCVFPMIPITVSYFTNRVSSRRAAVRDAVIYALGIILTFTALGLLSAVLFGATGLSRFAASPWLNLAITIIFVGFALSLLGAYNIQLPSRVLTRIDSFSRNRESTKVLGVLLMGLTFSVTSFTCTAPFVGTLLVMASQGQWVYPIIGMLAFSTAFALPFFILALSPQLVSHLPKSGGWLNSVKVVLGLLEIAAAMKFLSNVDMVWRWSIFTREVVLATWIAVTLLIGLYLLGRIQLSHDSATSQIGAGKLITALVFLALGFYLLTGLFGRPVGELESFLPVATDASSAVPANVNNTAPSSISTGELSWIVNDYEGALKQAKAEEKPIFIDFTGYTCTNCRWMEVNMFTKAPVKEELAKYIRARLYTDGQGQPYEGFQKMQQDKFGTVALPLYAVVTFDGKAIITFAGLTRSEPAFVEFLKAGHAKFQNVDQSLSLLLPTHHSCHINSSVSRGASAWDLDDWDFCRQFIR
jgi:thiol:disulfide interchange protein